MKRNKVQRELTVRDLNLNWARYYYYLSKFMEGKNSMTNKPIMGSPVQCDSLTTEIAQQVAETCDYADDYAIPCDAESPTAIIGTTSSRTPENLQRMAEEMKEKKKEMVAVNFADQIKIDFIPSIDYRIMCRFLGVTSVNDIKNHPYQSHPLITLILMECLIKFMEDRGFSFAGELNFDQQGRSIPPEKNPWNVQGKETTFTTSGFLYFEKIDGKKQDNVVFFLFFDLERGGASIVCYTTDTNEAKETINGLGTFAKDHNCLRGAKLKDVNIISASFSEVEVKDNYTWDNFYYPESIKELFELEIFGFVKNVKKYNDCGIIKRGIILYGRAGCVIKGTKIKIRKKKKEGGHKIISE